VNNRLKIEENKMHHVGGRQISEQKYQVKRMKIPGARHSGTSL
jgi:hypothetical protein